MMFANFFKPLAIKIMSGAIIGLLLMLSIVMWRADVISGQRDDARELAAVEKANHLVTKASLAGLEQRMAALVEDGRLRAEALEEALEDVAEDTAPLRAQADALERGEINISEVEGL